MKKSLYLFVATILNTIANAQTDLKNPERKMYEFFPSSKIEVIQNADNFYPEIKAGEKVVFKYTFHASENPMVTDDELSENVIFEVDASWNSFVFIKKLAMAKPMYQLGCFCAERGYYEITGGKIRGKKLKNGNYAIAGKVTMQFKNGVTKTIAFDGIFKSVHAD